MIKISNHDYDSMSIIMILHSLITNSYDRIIKSILSGVNFLSRKCVNSAALFVALPGARFPSSPCDFNMPISNILSKNLHT